jgi:hypothetical protein
MIQPTIILAGTIQKLIDRSLDYKGTATGSDWLAGRRSSLRGTSNSQLARMGRRQNRRSHDSVAARSGIARV